MQENIENNESSNDFNDGILEGGYQENINQPQQIPTSESDSRNNLIVNYLPSTMTEAQLKEIFQDYGELESVKLMTDKMTKVSLGYGFVKYYKDEDAQKAIENLNGKKIRN